MFYKKELEFFISFIENCKVRTHIIIDNNIPENLDLGIRQLLGIDEDYFNTFDFGKSIVEKFLKPYNDDKEINPNDENTLKKVYEGIKKFYKQTFSSYMNLIKQFIKKHMG